jgi:DNA-binding MurR/RpiR family transcriptional regulator
MQIEQSLDGRAGILVAIERASATFTKLEAKVAAYLTGRPEAVLVETSAEIAEKLDVSPMTVTRFFKKLGFEGSVTARSELKQQLFGNSTTRVDHRLASLTASRGHGDSNQADFEVAVAGLRRAHRLREEQLWKDVVELIARSDSLYITGFQSMRYLAEALSIRLSYLRGNVHQLDGHDGVYAPILGDRSTARTLIIIDTFRYASHGPLLADLAKRRGFNVVVFCDEFCEWAAKITRNVLIFPSENHFFIDMPTGIHSALNFMVQDVISALGGAVDDQIALITEAQDTFGQFSR